MLFSHLYSSFLTLLPFLSLSLSLSITPIYLSLSLSLSTSISISLSLSITLCLSPILIPILPQYNLQIKEIKEKISIESDRKVPILPSSLISFFFFCSFYPPFTHQLYLNSRLFYLLYYFINIILCDLHLFDFIPSLPYS